MLVLFLLLSCTCASRWAVELQEGVDPHVFASQHGIEYVGTVMDRRYHIFNDQIHHSERALRGPFFTRDTPQIVWADEQVKQHRFKRSLEEEDPLYEQQWHLHGSSPASIDVDQISNYTGGRGVIIAFVDDGLQHRHPEINANYDSRHSKNFNSGGGNDPDPRSSQDGHGTSAAGVAVGVRGNGVCGHGVAFAASAAGLRLIAEPVDDVDEAEALSSFSTMIHIYSNSWGPADSGDNMDAPGRLVRETFARFVGDGRGRGGKGLIYAWASGNGRAESDSCAYDGYAGNPYVFAIGAVDVSGHQAWYSEGCSALTAVMPSSGLNTGITTADLMGAAGYTPGNCTNTFGGTSSAAPLAAGVIALLLERRPDLTWRDIKHIIARGATRIDPSHREWVTNAAGFKHSNCYGFGLLKVPPLLGVLANYTLVPAPQVQIFSDEIRPHDADSSIIQPQDDRGSNYTVTFRSNITFVEIVVLSVALRHPSRGNVAIYIYSPSGTRSLVAPYHPDRHADYPTGWSFSSLAFWGESSNGTWIVQLQDRSTTHAGHLQWLRLGVWGY
jgi:hypothetical protein